MTCSAQTRMCRPIDLRRNRLVSASASKRPCRMRQATRGRPETESKSKTEFGEFGGLNSLRAKAVTLAMAQRDDSGVRARFKKINQSLRRCDDSGSLTKSFTLSGIVSCHVFEQRQAALKHSQLMLLVHVFKSVKTKKALFFKSCFLEIF